MFNKEIMTSFNIWIFIHITIKDIFYQFTEYIKSKVGDHSRG